MIYPYMDKLTSSVMKQFFAPKKEHQILSRSRLRRFLMLSATRFDYKKFDGLLANLSSRMTNSHNVSALAAQKVGMLQVGV